MGYWLGVGAIVYFYRIYFVCCSLSLYIWEAYTTNDIAIRRRILTNSGDEEDFCFFCEVEPDLRYFYSTGAED